jgi:hypothetical protein
MTRGLDVDRNDKLIRSGVLRAATGEGGERDSLFRAADDKGTQKKKEKK